jgi:hypothetical protein
MKRARPTIDDRPGALPDIRMTGSGVTFVLTPAGTDTSARLIIRCDDEGGIWMAIQHDERDR